MKIYPISIAVSFILFAVFLCSVQLSALVYPPLLTAAVVSSTTTTTTTNDLTVTQDVSGTSSVDNPDASNSGDNSNTLDSQDTDNQDQTFGQVPQNPPTPPVKEKTYTLRVYKDIAAGSPNGEFKFKVTGEKITDPITFSINTADAVFYNVTGLSEGTYAVTETLPDSGAWEQTSTNCDAVKVPYVANQAITSCRIKNTRKKDGKTGSLEVMKLTNGGKGAFSFTIDGPSFAEPKTFSIDTNQGRSKVFDALKPGVYHVKENVPVNWKKTRDTCGTVEITVGTASSCVITNQIMYGSLKIIKKTIGGGNEEKFSFTVTGDGNAEDYSMTVKNHSGYVLVPNLTSGSKYTVIEKSRDGWKMVSNTCKNVVIELGKTKECSLVNSENGTQKALLRINKIARGGDGTFEFTVSKNNGARSDLDFKITTSGGTGYKDLDDITAGTFTVEEKISTGWVVNNQCKDVAVAAGEVKNCTVFNVANGQKKQVLAPSNTSDSVNAVFVARDVVFGQQNASITILQKFLNGHGFSIASSGPGSPRNETGYFGNATLVALKNFQTANGLSASSNALGKFGPWTQAIINEKYGGISNS